MLYTTVFPRSYAVAASTVAVQNASIGEVYWKLATFNSAYYVHAFEFKLTLSSSDRIRLVLGEP